MLGLASDEIYTGLLRLIVERDPAGVFDLIDRLIDSGADLTELCRAPPTCSGRCSSPRSAPPPTA